MSFWEKIKETILEHPKVVLSTILIVLLVGDIIFILPRSKDWGISLATNFIGIFIFVYVVDFLLTVRQRMIKK